MSLISGSSVTGAGGPSQYQISRSLRFNSANSAYLNRTPASAGNRRTWTFSVWMKLASSYASTIIFSAGTSGNFVVSFGPSGNEYIRIRGTTLELITTQVFRDFGSWYNFTFTADSTNATAADRFRFYVNGVRVTAFSTNISASPSEQFEWNNNSAHNIMRFAFTSASYSNGYLTEINFIDGQALDPSSFGEYNATTGVWQPKEYTGTYGTNGFYLPMSAGTTFSGFFDGSNDYLSVASNAAWQYGTGDFTLEWWLFGTTSGSFSNQNLIGRYNVGASAFGMLQIDGTNIYWYYGNGAAYTFTLGSALNTNQWYHMAVSRSGTSLRFFLNGTQVGSTQTDSTNYSGTAEFRIINAHQTSATYFPGYISNVRVVKGTAVYTANFTPSTAPLTAITNTVLLTCQSSTFIDNSTNNFAITNNGGAITQLFSPFYFDATDDQSGNGNNWQPNNLNLTTTGVGADNLVDVPTPFGTDTGVGGEVRGNYCTLNPVKYVTNSITYSNGNLQYKPGSSWSTTTYVEGTIGVLGGNTGKYYWELSADQDGQYYTAGVALQNNTIGGSNIGTTGSVMLYDSSKYVNGTATGSFLTRLSVNEVMGVALDASNGKVWFRDSGGWLGSGDPAAGTNEAGIITGFSGGTLVPVSQANSIATVTVNWGQRAFAYTAPSGFKALCTQNLPDPTIVDGGEYFNTVLYTGTGAATLAITGVGFQPDWVWAKKRSAVDNHVTSDAVRGVQNDLFPNTTAAASANSNGLQSFNADGFTIGSGSGSGVWGGNSGATYVAWNWRANGAGSSNTAGSITSTVSVNTTSGFSIATYTGNGSSSQTVGHGLGVAPGMVIIKTRSNSDNWRVWHTSLTSGQTLTLNTTAAQAASGFWPSSPSSTVVSLGTDSSVNSNTRTYVMYCFAPVAGYSAFGSYTGNGSADGPFIFTNFRPRWLMIKRTDSTSNWWLYDTARGTSNVVFNWLYADGSGAEDTGGTRSVDILSNGFKLRRTDADYNANGGTFVYACFAENPFKYSLAR